MGSYGILGQQRLARQARGTPEDITPLPPYKPRPPSKPYDDGLYNIVARVKAHQSAEPVEMISCQWCEFEVVKRWGQDSYESLMAHCSGSHQDKFKEAKRRVAADRAVWHGP